MEVIKLDPKNQDEFSIKKIKKHSCSHKYIEVDVEEREVRCQNCNTVIDPFEFIFGLATETENHISHKHFIENEVRELQDKKIKLEKEVTNLKAKVRKANIPVIPSNKILTNKTPQDEASFIFEYFNIMAEAKISRMDQKVFSDFLIKKIIDLCIKYNIDSKTIEWWNEVKKEILIIYEKNHSLRYSKPG